MVRRATLGLTALMPKNTTPGTGHSSPDVRVFLLPCVGSRQLPGSSQPLTARPGLGPQMLVASIDHSIILCTRIFVVVSNPPQRLHHTTAFLMQAPPSCDTPCDLEECSVAVSSASETAVGHAFRKHSPVSFGRRPTKWLLRRKQQWHRLRRRFRQQTTPPVEPPRHAPPPAKEKLPDASGSDSDLESDSTCGFFTMVETSSSSEDEYFSDDGFGTDESGAMSFSADKAGVQDGEATHGDAEEGHEQQSSQSSVFDEAASSEIVSQVKRHAAIRLTCVCHRLSLPWPLKC